MAEKGRLLCVEELDLIEFLVASLSSSLACKVAIVKSPVAHEVVILQFEPVIPSANPSPPTFGDAPTAVVRSSIPPTVALELQAIDVGKFFKRKPLDITALEVCHKGTTSVCAPRRARLAANCRGCTFELPIPHLPIKVVMR
jgi:hypothetical protein